MQSIEAEDKKGLSSFGLNNPEATVRIGGGGVAQTLALGKKEDNHVHAMNSALDPVFTVDGSFITDFEKKASDLRAKDLFTYSTFEVKRLEVTTPVGAPTFEKQAGKKWKQTAPAAKDVPTEKVEALLDKLRDLRAESFPLGDSVFCHPP